VRAAGLGGGGVKVVLFCHSLVSDWNHGNAHFLRGVLRELQGAGHETVAWEPAEGWSARNLLADAGPEAIAAFHRAFPELRSRSYSPAHPDLDRALAGAGLVIVHDWNAPELIAALGRHRRTRGRYVLLFYDAHHRAASAPEQLARLDLSGYDGVLAFGAALREAYLERGLAERVHVWHEAADTALFCPLERRPEADLVWIGNWGDGERSRELVELLARPAWELGCGGDVYGVRYPPAALQVLAAAGLRYRGWLANFEAPEVFARHRVTVHIPRRAYVRRLPGIPTIRVFEALACGIPLICAPWEDREGLFRPGRDYLIARDCAEMSVALRAVLAQPRLAESLRRSGLERIRQRHTCAHRAQELLAIAEELGAARTGAAA
jgi:spore maturation protein CgeB